MSASRAVQAACFAGALGLHPLGAQEATPAPQPRECRDILNTGTKDTVRLRALLQMHAADRSRDVPDWFQEEFGEAVRTFLKIPAPLGIDVYETRGDSSRRTAHLAVRSTIEASLGRDGRVRDARVTGGSRNAAIDRALLDALRAVDSSGVLASSGASAVTDSRVPIIVLLSTGDESGPSKLHSQSEILVSTVLGPHVSYAPQGARSDSGVSVPLFAFRTPQRIVTRMSRMIPGFGSFRYPTPLVNASIAGTTIVAYVIETDGKSQPESLTALRMDRSELFDSVRRAQSSTRYHALEVDNCAVRHVVEQTFRFQPRS